MSSEGECLPLGPLIKHRLVDGEWQFWKWEDIPDARDLRYTYLRRLRIVKTPYFRLYLHFIFVKDLDRDPHDHPWNFWSLVLRGGYTESIYPWVKKRDFRNYSRTHKRFSLHRMVLGEAHRITHMQPGLITLVFTGRHSWDWGFWTQDGFLKWRDYNLVKFGHSTNLPPVDEFA